MSNKKIRSSYCDTEAVSKLSRAKNGYKTRSSWSCVYNGEASAIENGEELPQNAERLAYRAAVVLRHRVDCVVVFVQPPSEALTDDLSPVTLNKGVVFRVKDK